MRREFAAVTVGEAAERTGSRPRTIADWVRRGAVESVPHGDLSFVSLASLAARCPTLKLTPEEEQTAREIARPANNLQGGSTGRPGSVERVHRPSQTDPGRAGGVHTDEETK